MKEKTISSEDILRGFFFNSKGKVINKDGRTCVSKPCETCGKIFWAPKRFDRAIKGKPQMFCSRKCFGASDKYKPPMVGKGEENHNWKGGFSKSRGYPIYSHGINSGRAVHRVIAETALGRRLLGNEVVHHINGIKADNRKANLLICSNAYHKQLHDKMAELYMKEKFR